MKLFHIEPSKEPGHNVYNINYQAKQHGDQYIKDANWVSNLNCKFSVSHPFEIYKNINDLISYSW